MYQSDIVIVGSGITGTFLARELSRYHVSVTVVDRGSDIADGATKANSGIVHAGYDALPGTKKAFFNVRGAEMYASVCAELAVPYQKSGALVIGFSDQDRDTLVHLMKRGESNGVRDLSILSRSDLLALEPSLNQEVSCALNVPGSAIVSPYELAFALADHAALNGVRFLFNEEVTHVEKAEDGLWTVRTSEKELRCRIFINCAGASGADIHNMISDFTLRMTHRRGQYYLLDRTETLPFSRTIFQCPSPMGKGVLVSPTVHGNVLIGPNAEDISDPLDTATTADGLSFVLEKARRTWPGLSVRNNITNFSGIRAHLDTDDFMIGPVSGSENAYEAIGIESPGLSSAPAIALYLAEMIAQSHSLEAKRVFIPYPCPEKPFSEMTDEERKAAVMKNPEHGRIICRCETVTEAEIRNAIRRPVGARTIDGVKRRTRAGMGRCQGGFCSPRVAQILSEETGVPLTGITKSGGNSFLLSDTVESFLKGESRND